MNISRWLEGLSLAAVLILLPAATALAQPQGFHAPTPGARANGMGGAFIAVADDGSTTIANPAGLMNLTRPQIYVEFTSANAATAEDFSTNFDTKNLRVNAFSFLSASAPVGSRVAVGATINEFYNAEDTFDTSVFSAHGHDYGGSIAVSATSSLRLGATVTADHFAFSQRDPQFGEFNEDNWAAGITLGGLWQASEKVGVGFVGAYGDEIAGPPSRIGAGVSIRPSSRLLTSADLVWTRLFAGDATTPSDTMTALHLGGEYSIPRGSGQLFIRAGGYVGAETDSSGSPQNNAATFGVGYTGGPHFQVDLAYVTAFSRLVVSSAVRF